MAPSGMPTFACEFCPARFATTTERDLHMLRVHFVTVQNEDD